MKLIVVFSVIAVAAGLFVGSIYQDWQDFKQETNLTFNVGEPFECGVVLTGGPGRIREGIELLDKKMIRKLIISGVSPHLEKKDLISRSELHDKIFLDKKSRSTYGNAIHTTSAMLGIGCHDLVVITSSLHIFRAYRVFRSLLPEPYRLARQSVAPTYDDATVIDRFWEISKTIFYRIWIYDA